MKNWGGVDNMYTKRKEDRRRFGGKTSFPLKTKSGFLVEEERRCIPDRRLGNIHLELIDVEDLILTDCFTATNSRIPGKERC
jgi:hypothetical protein